MVERDRRAAAPVPPPCHRGSARRCRPRSTARSSRRCSSTTGNRRLRSSRISRAGLVERRILRDRHHRRGSSRRRPAAAHRSIKSGGSTPQRSSARDRLGPERAKPGRGRARQVGRPPKRRIGDRRADAVSIRVLVPHHPHSIGHGRQCSFARKPADSGFVPLQTYPKLDLYKGVRSQYNRNRSWANLARRAHDPSSSAAGTGWVPVAISSFTTTLHNGQALLRRCAPGSRQRARHPQGHPCG